MRRAGRAKAGPPLAIPEIETKPIDAPEGARRFTIITDQEFVRLEDAGAFAANAVSKIQSVNEEGVPHPLAF